jgi:uncharacterized PurR-regulated membrane protein YhhQ (DUF165 family)
MSQWRRWLPHVLTVLTLILAAVETVPRALHGDPVARGMVWFGMIVLLAVAVFRSVEFYRSHRSH